MLTQAEMAGWQARLDALHAHIGRHFRRAEARARAKRYLSGLLQRVERKNGWQLAEHLGETGPQGVQRQYSGGEYLMPHSLSALVASFSPPHRS